MLRIMGPVLGYFVGGKCLSVWIDPSLQPNLTRKDPRWYGAWWIGTISRLLWVRHWSRWPHTNSCAFLSAGLASFVSLVFGTGLGGAVLRWAHPGPRFVTGYNIFITLLTCASYIILSFVGCPRLDVLGPVDG